MLHVALLCLLVGRVPPPPVPQSYCQSSPEDQPPADPKAQRKWLMDHLIADLQSQGKYDAQKFCEIETMLNSVTDEQVSHALQYYQRRKAQQFAEAEANLHRLEAYRDRLKLEVEHRRQVLSAGAGDGRVWFCTCPTAVSMAVGEVLCGPVLLRAPPVSLQALVRLVRSDLRLGHEIG